MVRVLNSALLKLVCIMTIPYLLWFIFCTLPYCNALWDFVSALDFLYYALEHEHILIKPPSMGH